MTRVVLLLICTLLTMELTMAGYNKNLLNLIIRPAGRSRSFKWLGNGDIKNIPYVPRPIFIPRWIPKERPEYVAKWVPTTPGPKANSIQSSHHSGFGTPKTNSVVDGQNAPLPSDLPPIKSSSISLKAPTPVHAPASGLSTVHAASPVSSEAPSQTIAYSPPHADDIIQLSNALPETVATNSILPTPYATEQLPAQPNIIPDTAIRNIVPETSGAPSFSALVQDQLTVDISDFHPLDPSSIIITEDGLTNNKEFANIIISDAKPTHDVVHNLKSVEPFTIENLPEQQAPVLNGVQDQIQIDHNSDSSTTTNENELIFVVDSNPSLQPTTVHLTDVPHGNLQVLPGDAGKSLDALVSTQIIEPVQSHIVSPPLDEQIIFQQNPETLFIEDTSLITQPDLVNKLHSNNVNNDILKITDINQVNEPHFSLNTQNEHSITSNSSPLITGQAITDAPQFIVEFEPNKETETINLTSVLQQRPNSQNAFIPSNANDVILINTGIVQPAENFPSDQQAQFSNFQIGQKVKFDPLPIQDHDTSNRPETPLFLRPELLAPPASPVIASERSFSAGHSDNEKSFIPSGRSISTDLVIPQPVPIPMGPLASVTLDFPAEGPGVRQARVDSSLLPFGTRLHSRPSRRFRSYPLRFGK